MSRYAVVVTVRVIEWPDDYKRRTLISEKTVEWAKDTEEEASAYGDALQWFSGDAKEEESVSAQ